MDKSDESNPLKHFNPDISMTQSSLHTQAKHAKVLEHREMGEDILPIQYTSDSKRLYDT